MLLVRLGSLSLVGCRAKVDETGDPSIVVEQQGPIVCTAPSALAYEPIAPGDFGSQVATSIDADPRPGLGVLVEDLTGDGRYDILLPNMGQDQLFVGTADGGFADETASRWPQSDDASLAAIAFDREGDGDLDVFIANEAEPNKIFDNDGTGVFVDVTASVLAPDAWASRGATFGDIDGDGDLDAFVSNHTVNNGDDRPKGSSDLPGDPNQLLRNDDGVFVDISEPLGIEAREGFTQVSALVDLDGDRALDLYQVNEYRGFYPDCLLLNDGDGGFAMADEASGVHVGVAGMGLGLGDINDDGRPDMLVTSWGSLVLLESTDTGQWFDTAASRGLRPLSEDREVARSAELVDIDNDGDLDAVVAFAHKGAIDGHGKGDPELQPDAVFLFDGTSFTEVSADIGLDDTARHWALVPVDLDGDGVLDLVRRDIDGPATIMQTGCLEAGWLEIDLRQEGGANSRAIGAQVVVSTGEQRQVRWVTAGATGMASSVPYRVHVGLGAARTAELRITWPDGYGTVIADVEANQLVRVTRHLDL